MRDTSKECNIIIYFNNYRDIPRIFQEHPQLSYLGVNKIIIGSEID